MESGGASALERQRLLPRELRGDLERFEATTQPLRDDVPLRDPLAGVVLIPVGVPAASAPAIIFDGLAAADHEGGVNEQCGSVGGGLRSTMANRVVRPTRSLELQDAPS